MPLPEMKPVSSSTLASVGYDKGEKSLYVTFKNGSTYVYKGVPKNLHDSLISSPSTGSFLAQMVKGKYPYSQV